MSASKAEAKRRIHKPVWRHNDESILSKSSWSGLLDEMQYFATVTEDELEEISWLPMDSIGEYVQSNGIRR